MNISTEKTKTIIVSKQKNITIEEVQLRQLRQNNQVSIRNQNSEKSKTGQTEENLSTRNKRSRYTKGFKSEKVVQVLSCFIIKVAFY